MTPIDRILEHLPDAKRRGKGWTARCPGHDDRKASLSVDTGEQGRVLLYCFAGCATPAVVAAMGLTLRDLYPDESGHQPRPSSTTSEKRRPSPPRTSNGTRGRAVAVYHYHAADGLPAFEVRRYEPKTFRPYKPDGKAGYPDGPRPLYCLGRLLEAGAASLVFIVEGEKDADRLAALGLVAVTCAGGANAAGKTDCTPLAGREVAVLPDHDKTGRAFGQAVAGLLHGSAAGVRVLDLAKHWPGLLDKGDVSDWLDADPDGHDGETLVRLFDAADQWAPEPAALTGEPATAQPCSAPMLLRMSDVQPTTVRWLWPGRIPLGRMTLLVGRPGEGKSFLTADIAARVSQGRDWPDGSGCPAGSVLLCSAEDDPADTIAPRLIAHDADRQRIHLLAGVMQRTDDGREAERIFTLADLDPLRDALEQLDDCRLIVVDPVGSYLGGGADAHRDNEVRGVLAPLCKLADRHDAALIVVAHTRKSAAAHADDMALGSRAFTGLARSVLHLLVDPDGDEDPELRRRLLLPGKNNLAKRPDGLAFDIGPGDAIDDTGQPRPCIRWQRGTVDITADDAVNRELAGDNDKRTERDQAADWLRQTLAAGPQPSKALLEQAKETEGIAERTLRRAMKAVGVDAYRPENPGPWWWRLPNGEAQRHGPKGVQRGNLAICPDACKTGDPDDGLGAGCHTARADKPDNTPAGR